MAIIGRGDLSKEIPDREGFLFYATGNSNRNPLTDYSKQKEMDDVKFYAQRRNRMFVYFSSLSIYYSDSEYTKHKDVMETVVRVHHDNYCIMRLGNITWGDNPNTLVNYLTQDQSKVERVYRYLLDISEFKHWTSMIPRWGKHEMNVTGKLTFVPDLIKQINESKVHTNEQRLELLPPAV